MSKSSSSEQLNWNADEPPDKSREVSVVGRLSHSWPSGPRTVVLHRCDRGFGFTLRHFIVYPDEAPKNQGYGGGTGPEIVEDGLTGCGRSRPLEPMDTIFVKHVKDGGPAQKAGLNTGDRVVSVNGETVVGKTYAYVVQLIQRSGNVLQLLVVPKEDDILQLYFPGTAYRSSPECQQALQDVVGPSNGSVGRSHLSGGEGMLLTGGHPGRPELPSMAEMSRRRFSELLPSYRAEMATVTPAGSDWSMSSAGLSGRPVLDQVNASHRSQSTSILSPILTTSTASDLITKPTSYNNAPSMGYYIGGKRYDPPGKPPWAISNLSESTLRPQPPASEYYVAPQPRFISSSASQAVPKYSESQESASLQDTPPASLSSLSSREPSIEHPDLIPESIISRLRATFEKKEEFLLRPTAYASSTSSGQSLSGAADGAINFNNPFPPLLHPSMSSSSLSNVAISKEPHYHNPQKTAQLMHNQSWPPPLELANEFNEANSNSMSYPFQMDSEPNSSRHPKQFVSNLTRIQENIPTSESSASKSRNAGIVETSSQIRRLGCDSDVINSTPSRAPVLGARQLLMLRGETPLLRKACSLDSELLPSASRSNALNNNNNNADNSDGSSASMDTMTWDDINGDSTSAVHMVSRRARQFEKGALEREANLRMNFYKNELARMTTRGETPKVSDRTAQFESLSTSQETIGSESDHCPSPRQRNAVLKKDVLASSVSTRQNDVTAKDPMAEIISPEDIDDAQRHKAKRQNSYLTAVNTPFQDLDYIMEGFDDGVQLSQRRHLVPNSLALISTLSDGTVSAPVSPQGSSWNHQELNGLYQPQLGSLQGLSNSSSTEHFDCMISPHLLNTSSNRSMPVKGGGGGGGSLRPGAIGCSSGALSPPLSTTGVVLRRKTVFEEEEEEEAEDDSEDGRTMRRVSYLRATSGEAISKDGDGIHSDSSGKQQQSEFSKGSSIGSRNQSIQKLKAFFGERTPHIVESAERRPLREFAENSQTSPGDFKEGWLYCKMAAIDGKRATDRSWKQMWVVLKDTSLHLYKDKKDSTGQALATLDEQHLIDLKNCRADIATDYTKKKHVFRLTTLAGSQYLFQADSNAEMQRWIRVIQANLDNKLTETGQGMVLRKSALFEREIGGRLSPQPGPKGIRKLTTFRNRSPTGHSPTSKTRKSSQTDDTSPKSKTWRGKMVKTIRKIHGTSPTSATQPEGLTIGVPLEFCPSSSVNEFVPLLLELCTGIVEARGLEVVGIYRVPGNTTAVSFLMDAVNHGFDCLNLQDPKWNDVNVISSLLKAFFRKLPEPLVTAELYPFFIEASKSDDPVRRVYGLKKVLQELPDHNYETLKFLIDHLRKIVAHSNVNKMEARNLAIVFGPTLVRAADDNMVTMVTDMSYQCRIVEMLISHGDWFFNGDENDDAIYENLPYANGRKADSNSKQISNQSLLLNNVQKMGQPHGDVCKTSRDVSAKDLVSTIIGAANRKVRQKMKKHHSAVLPVSSEVTNERDIDREIELRLRMLKPKYVPVRTKDAEQKASNRITKAERRHSEDNSMATSSNTRTISSSDNFSSVRKMSVDSMDSGQPERIFCVVRQPSKKSTWSGDSLDALSEQQQQLPNDDDDVIVVDSMSLATEKSQLDAAATRSNNSMQERIRRFELETKALLERNLHLRHKRDLAQRELDRQRIEAEWQRANKEIGQEDFLDQPAVTKKISDFTQKIESLHASPHRASKSDQQASTSSSSSNSTISPMRPITDGTISYRRAKPLAERTLATARSARPPPSTSSLSSSASSSSSSAAAYPQHHSESVFVGHRRSAPHAAFKRVGSIENFRTDYGAERDPPAALSRQRPLNMVRPRPRVSQNCDNGDDEFQPSQLKSRFCGSLDSLREFYETTKETEAAAGVPRRPPRRTQPPPLGIDDRSPLTRSGDDVHIQRNENTRITATLSPTTHTVSTTSTTSIITATIISGSSIPLTASARPSQSTHASAVDAAGAGRSNVVDDSSAESEAAKLSRISAGNSSSPNPRRKSSHLRNLKRRHTVGGTKDFEKFRLLVGSSMTGGGGGGGGCDAMEASSKSDGRRSTGWSAWERLRPAVSQDGFEEPTQGRSMKSWLQRERLRTSTPDLLNLQQRAPSSSSSSSGDVKWRGEPNSANAAQNVKPTLESQV